MPKKYVKMSLPIEFHNAIKHKKDKMNMDLQRWGIKGKVTMTKLFIRMSEIPITFNTNDDLIKFARRRY